MKKSRWALLVLLLVALLVAGCGAPQAQEAAEGEEENPIIFFGSGTTVPEPYMMPLLTLGRDNLADQGITMEFVSLSSDEAVEAALDRGRVDVALLSTVGLNRAASQGLDLRYVLGTEMHNTFVLAAPSDFTEAEDFRDTQVGVQSRTSLSIAVAEVLLREQGGLDAGTDYEMVFLPGSDARAAAMEAGNLDAAVLFRSVAADLENKTDGRFAIYGGLWDVLDPMLWEGLAMSAEFRENEELATTFVRAMLDAYEEFYQSDPQELAAMKDTVPGSDALDAEELAGDFELYQEIGMFPVDGGLEQEHYDAMVDFLLELGQLEQDQVVPYEEAVDTSILETAQE